MARSPARINPASSVDLHQLVVGPLYSVLSRRALHCLRVHVDDNVFRYGLGGGTTGWSRITHQPTDIGELAEGQQHRVDIPNRILFPIFRRAVGVALLRGEPLLEYRLRVDPAQKVLGRLLILRIAHHQVGEWSRQRELAAGPLWEPGVEDVLPQRLTLLSQVGVGFLLCFQVNRRAVVSGADRAGQKRTVVARIIPGEAALVTTILPKADRELDRVDRLLAVESDGLAVGLDLLASPGPQIGIPEPRRIAEGMTEGLAKGPTGGLELLASRAILVPSLRELASAVADLGEPRFAIGQQSTADRPWHSDPFPAHVVDCPGDVVKTTLRPTDLFGDVTYVGDAGFIKAGPVVDDHDDIGTGARLHRRSDARLDAIGINQLEIELDANVLLALRDNLGAEQLIRCRHEIGPAQPVNRRSLAKSRGPAGSQDRG